MAPLILDNVAERQIDEAYRMANGPIQLKTQTERYIVLTVRDYAALESPLSEDDKQSLLSGRQDVEKGNITDFDELLQNLGARYGF